MELDEERQEVAFHGCRAGDPDDGLAARIACQPELQAGHQAAWPFQADARERRRRCQLRVQLSQRSEEHTSELQSLMRISYAVFCLKKKQTTKININSNTSTQIISIIIATINNQKI